MLKRYERQGETAQAAKETLTFINQRSGLLFHAINYNA